MYIMKVIICLLYIPLLYASEHLPCSRSVTNILFINGMFNTRDDSVASAEQLRHLYSSNLRKNEIDSSGNVSVTSVYNKSLYKINEELGGNNATAGKFSDIIEVAGQYIEDRVDLRMGEPESAWALISTYFTRVAAAKYKKDPEFKKNVIVFSHSQGNFFANKVYDKIFLNSEENEVYQDLWGNLIG